MWKKTASLQLILLILEKGTSGDIKFKVMDLGEIYKGGKIKFRIRIQSGNGNHTSGLNGKLNIKNSRGETKLAA